MKKLIVHLVSESSGRTVKFAAKTALAKFSNLDVTKYHWQMTKNIKMLEEVFEKIKRKPGIVLHTLSDKVLTKSLEQFCFDKDIPCISVVKNIIDKISEFVDQKADIYVRNDNKFDESYFNKVDAIDYSLRHDDGKSLDDIEDADIILIGPSRSSKTPTSVFLAYNGFKTVNIPYIYDIPFPESILNLKTPMIVGLIINPSRLISIRESRMNFLRIKKDSNYTDIKIIQEECRQVKQLCLDNDWKMVDVSSRSIEETAAIITKYYYERRKI